MKKYISILTIFTLIFFTVSDTYAKTRSGGSRSSSSFTSKSSSVKPKSSTSSLKKKTTSASKSKKVDSTKKKPANATTKKTIKSKPFTMKPKTKPKKSNLYYNGLPVYYVGGSAIYFSGEDCDVDDYLEGGDDCQAYYADEDELSKQSNSDDNSVNTLIVLLSLLSLALLIVLIIVWIRRRK